MSTSPVLAVGPGSMLGRYQVLSHLASGGMAEIFLARATGLEGFERYVVVKCIKPEYARDERFVKMFIDEARLSAQLHHQNIAQVHDIGQAGGAYYFAMEYVHGENVRELLHHVAVRRARVPLDHVLGIVMGAAAGLQYAHDKRGPDRKPLDIVHRDVSPSNIIVSYDGSVKVVDFGIAKAAMRMSETRSGTLKGKIAYMSPEQCRGQAVDRRSDVFALGIVLYELATVTRLFKGESDYVTMNKIVTGNIERPIAVRPDLPPALDAIIMRALATNPDDRYPTVAAMLDELVVLAWDQRVTTSAIGLERYLRSLFGDKPEPWQVTSGSRPAMPAMPPAGDGSGSGDGVPPVTVTGTATPVESGMTHGPLPGSPTGLGSQGSLLLSAAEMKASPPVRQRRAALWLAGAILISGVLISGALALDRVSVPKQDAGEPGAKPVGVDDQPGAMPAPMPAIAVDAGVDAPAVIAAEHPDAAPAPATSSSTTGSTTGRRTTRPRTTGGEPAPRTEPPPVIDAGPTAPRRDSTQLLPPD